MGRTEFSRESSAQFYDFFSDYYYVQSEINKSAF